MRHLLSRILWIGTCAISLTWTGVVCAQPSFTLSATDASGFQGDSVLVQVLLDTSGVGSDLTGWSYGLCHDSAILDLVGAVDGITTTTSHGGAPPDFISLDLYPGGLTHGVVISFTGGFDLPPGSGYQLVEATYTLLPTQGSTDICFCDTLGTPPVQTIVVDADAIPHVPTQVCGTVSIIPPVNPVTGLTCTPTVLNCSCDAVIAWVNDGPYDSIRLYRDGVLHSTLAGTDTTATISGEVGLHEYCVEPERDAIIGAQTCCTADCPIVDVPATPVDLLTCTVDAATCTADLSWTNTSTYSFLRVLQDGVEVALLGGGDELASVTLPGAGDYQLCVEGETICGDPVAATCCDVSCGIVFRRADVNADGTVDIADPIAFLAFLFSSGVLPDCDDAMDANDDGAGDIADAIYALSYLFQSDTAPPAPFPDCGSDPTPDAQGCNDYPGCP